MRDYSKGKIYKIYSISNEELVYYGSTIKTLSARLANHVYDYKKNSSCVSKIVLDAGDYKIELIENYPCANKQQLDRREGEYAKNNVCVNENIAGRTLKEYNEDNKDKISEKHKEYYKKNKERIDEKQKKYRENNKELIEEKKKLKVTCECGCITDKNNLARHKKSNKHLELMK